MSNGFFGFQPNTDIRRNAMRIKKGVFVSLTLCVGLTLISVSALAQASAAPFQANDDNVQSVKITITDNGFEPGSFQLKLGVPARVTFLRQAEESCAKEVVIPAFHIKHALPFNEAVVVEFTPDKTGEFGFACGMGMLHGKLVVQ
jgi:plastocyanin domain-containing protein